MPIFSAEHRRLMQIMHPERHGEYSEFLASLGGFMEERVLPLSPKLDSGEAQIGKPRGELLNQGICQIWARQEDGGLGLPFSVYAMAIEMLGTADASIALSIEIHNAVAEGIRSFGSAEQKRRYLPDLASGRKLASFTLTEPASGSDARSMATTAKRDGDGFVINGSKTFITNAGEADLYLVFAKTEAGPSCFAVDAPNPGLRFGQDFRKLGMRGSRTAEVFFDGCRVPASSLVGEEGKGYDYARQILHGARVVVAALNVGISVAAMSKAAEFSRQRKAFGKAISEFQLTREKVADMRIGISSGRMMYLYAARLRDLGMDFESEASQAKVYATEMSLRVCDSAIQVFGGLGYTTDDVHRHWRDARLLTIGEGTSEVLRLLVARKELD